MTQQRGDLDLGNILGEDTAHYRDVLAGKAPPPRGAIRGGVPLAGNRPDGYVSRNREDPWKWETWPEPPPVPEYFPEIERFGTGLPDQASTCTDLALEPEICWDVCGYYRRLGVHWKATRWELLIAYQKRGGQRSPALTYALKQLLRDGGALRRRYDRMRLGQLFLEDRDVEQGLRRAAMKVAERRHGREADADEVADVLGEWGLGTVRRDQAENDFMSPQEGPRQESLEAGQEEPMLVTDNGRWLEEWGWYGLNVWQIHARAGEILAEWQALLVSAFRDRGITARFAVGLGPIPASFCQTRLNGPNGSDIFFISTEHPTREMAQEAIEGYLAHRQERS